MAFRIRVDTKAVEALAGRIEGITTRAEVHLGAIEAVNRVVTRADESIRAGEIRGINLTAAYVRSKTDLVLAVGKPSAQIITRGDLTIMGHYKPDQKREAGTPLRAGPTAGRRPSGVTYELRRGSPQTEGQWFTMRLRQGTQSGDKVGVFVRKSATEVKHIYGPSPYSLARFQIEAQGVAIQQDLADTALRVIGKRIEGALE